MITKQSWLIVSFAILSITSLVQAQNSSAKPGLNVDLISAAELKSKVDRNEPLVILDVRSSESYANSDRRIKGAIHVKVRRLEHRLNFPPLKDAPRDREVITYCACPSEEASIAAAQILISSGFRRVRALKGGWQEWLKVNGAVEPRPKG
jgi:rhodanese-related sulfurtransferase